MSQILKYIISSEINIETDLPVYEVEDRLRLCMSKGSELFPRSIISGKIYGENLSAIINTPNLAVDPFKSVVNGTVVSKKAGTSLKLTVTFGAVNILSLLVWYIPMFIVLQHKQNQDIKSIVVIFGICSLFSLLSLIFLRFKMKLDKSRLEKWLLRNLVEQK